MVSGIMRTHSFSFIGRSRIRAATAIGAALSLLALGQIASEDDEGFGTFGHISEDGERPVVPKKKPAKKPPPCTEKKKEAREPESSADPWGPVCTTMTSIVNLAPGLLVYFNNAPVF